MHNIITYTHACIQTIHVCICIERKFKACVHLLRGKLKHTFAVRAATLLSSSAKALELACTWRPWVKAKGDSSIDHAAIEHAAKPDAAKPRPYEVSLRLGRALNGRDLTTFNDRLKTLRRNICAEPVRGKCLRLRQECDIFFGSMTEHLIAVVRGRVASCI